MMTKPAKEKNKEFYLDKRVFVTGHTGFKGAWLTAILHELGAETTGYALDPEPGSLFEQIGGERLLHHVTGDVRDAENIKKTLIESQPEIVFHLAARALVKECYEHPRYTYETNVMGTVNLFEAIRLCPTVKSVVIVTTDKVYLNKGDGAVYVETDPLGGNDTYSGSKTCMEYVTEAYRQTYLQTPERMVGVSTVRASNVLGGGDHVQSRLIPSILSAVAAGKSVELRHPHQTRPWQSMLDALNGYLAIGRLMYQDPQKYSSQWNIGPTADGIREVLWVLEKMREYFISTSYIAVPALKVKESQTLGLDITKTVQETDWFPQLNCDESIYYVVDFFKQQLSGVPELDICRWQIKKFFEIA